MVRRLSRQKENEKFNKFIHEWDEYKLEPIRLPNSTIWTESTRIGLETDIWCLVSLKRYICHRRHILKTS